MHDFLDGPARCAWVHIMIRMPRRIRILPSGLVRWVERSVYTISLSSIFLSPPRKSRPSMIGRDYRGISGNHSTIHTRRIVFISFDVSFVLFFKRLRPKIIRVEAAEVVPGVVSATFPCTPRAPIDMKTEPDGVTPEYSRLNPSRPSPLD